MRVAMWVLLWVGWTGAVESDPTESARPNSVWSVVRDIRDLDDLLDFLSTVLGVDSEVCYPRVGCFSMTSPWFTLLRPLPKPQHPDVIDTRFYLYTRRGPDRHEDVDWRWSGFDASRATYVITHGFTHHGNKTWLSEMKDAILQEYDANVILVDWGKGAQQVNYFQAASNIRVVAQEVTRLTQYLITTQGADVTRWHLIGHSLGAHVLSYVAKSVPGVARLTALDPAQPAFEGYPAEVRLDISDAAFVDVVHTNARPFIPLVGFGMMAAHGHVDYYMNGGLDQPGCIVPPAKLFTFKELALMQGEELMNYVACPHQRSYEYFTASIRNKNCTFWGRRLQDMWFNKECDITSCTPLGPDAVHYPARGSFQVPTSAEPPFCTPNEDVNRVMRQIAPLSLTSTTTEAPTTTSFFESRGFHALFPWIRGKVVVTT